jgi:hypothetical protein
MSTGRRSNNKIQLRLLIKRGVLTAVVASANRRFGAATVRPAADLLFFADGAPLPQRERASSSVWASTIIISEPVDKEAWPWRRTSPM